MDSKGIPFQSAWDVYASNAVEVAVVNFFNKSENQNISSITSLTLEKVVKESVASTPIEIQNISILKSIIKKPIDKPSFQPYSKYKNTK